MKIRLYKGPFNGKSYATDGRNDIIIAGPKPMTRRQKFEWQQKEYRAGMFNPTGMRRLPQVEAHYRIAMRPIMTGSGVVYAPATHPDGSIFYEYVEGSKREY